MKTILHIIIVLAAFVTILMFIFFIDGHLDDKIERKITNQKYIAQLAFQLRPFLLFNQDEIKLYDHGASAFIEEFNIVALDSTDAPALKITFHFNQFFQTAPLLESNPFVYRIDIERGTGNSWIYNLSPEATFNIKNTFRLEILN